jgi:hypothetical protein
MGGEVVRRFLVGSSFASYVVAAYASRSRGTM